MGTSQLDRVSIGVVIGGLAKSMVQFPLRSTRSAIALSGSPNGGGDPGVRQILRLMGPGGDLLLRSADQCGGESEFARHQPGRSDLVELRVPADAVADRHLRSGGGTVTLPALSRAAIGGISKDFSPTLIKGLRLMAFLVVPSTIGLVVLAEPIISVIYVAWECTAAYGCRRAHSAGAADPAATDSCSTRR